MGVHGPVPKRSDQRHGHRKAEPVTKAPAAARHETPDGQLVYEPVVQWPVRAGLVDIVFEEEEEG